MSYSGALALTLIVELPVVSGFLGRSGGPTRRRAVGVALVANMITHPVVWLGLTHVAPAHYWSTFAALEAGACLVETAVLAGGLGLSVTKTAPVAVLSNALSCVAGLLLLAT